MDKYALRIDLAWEAQTYLHHTAFVLFANPSANRENYSMQGLTLTARLSF